MDIYLAYDMIKRRAGEKIFQHSLGVKNTAVHLARLYGLDPEKAALTGMLHDYGKLFDDDTLTRLARQYNLDDPILYQEPVLLHAPIGAILLREEMGLTDEDILEAIRVHTTGLPGMSLLARVIYIADYIEPGRTCPGVQAIRRLAYSNLEGALLAAVDFTIQYVMDRKKLLHPDSIAFRNSLVLSMRNDLQELSGL